MKKKINSRNKDLLSLIISIFGICLLAYFLNMNFFRLDLTSEKKYTLSDATKNILSKVKKPLYFEIYLAGDLPIGFKNLQKSLLELLDEYSIYSSKELDYMLINPSDALSSDIREAKYKSLQKRGLKASSLQHKKQDGSITQKIIFPSLILHNKEKEIVINFLHNSASLSWEENLNVSVENLEYELTNAISKITFNRKKTIAYLKGHGELNMLNVASVNSKLSENYNIIQISSNELRNKYKEVKTLIIAQPRNNFTEKDKYIIDQYIMNEGSVLWLIDEVDCSLDSLINHSSTTATYKPLNIDDQLFHYGVRINADLLLDKQCLLIPIQTSLPGTAKAFTPSPWYYSPLLETNTTHPISSNVGVVKGEFVNSINFVGTNEKIKKTVLLRSSNYTRLQKVPLKVSLDISRQRFTANDFLAGSRMVSVLLEGEFKSVFNNRINKNINKKLFKKQSINSKMIIVSDGDIIKNGYVGVGDNIKIHPLAYDRYSRQTYGNSEFLINAINYLSGDFNLISLRSREIKMRLLDKTLVRKNKFVIQTLNMIIPAIIILIFAFCFLFYRKYIYLKKLD